MVPGRGSKLSRENYSCVLESEWNGRNRNHYSSHQYWYSSMLLYENKDFTQLKVGSYAGRFWSREYWEIPTRVNVKKER